MIIFSFGHFRVGLRFGFLAVLFFMTQISRSDWRLWCVFCCILHELGHLAAYALAGSPPRELWLEAGGMRIVPREGFLPPAREALVLLGGCFANFVSAAALFFLRCPRAAGFHLLLGIWNLLPLAPLDGGQLLRLALDLLCPAAAPRIAAAVHWGCAALLAAAGLLLFRETGNFTLLLTLFCLFFSGK